MAEWYGSALVLGSDQGLPAALVARLPPEHDRRTVLVLAGAPTDIVAALREALPADTRSIRLAASYGARTRLAQQVSDELEIEVVSPSGPVLLVDPGALFVGDGGAWLTHRPGQKPTLGGSRHPTPSWQVELPKLAHLRRRGLLGHEIPAGYWWYRPSRRQRQVAQDDPAFAVAPRPDQITVLIGRPGTRPPSAAAIYDRLAALPESVRERLLLVPYGSSATELDDVAERFSSDFRVTVERTAGMQVRRGDEDSCLAPDGTRALVQSVAYNGSGTPRITSWFSPIAGGLTKDDSTAPVGTRFTLDVVRCGLYLRDADMPASPEVYGRPADPHRDTFFIESADIDAAVTHAKALADRLPADVAARLQTLTRARVGVAEPPKIQPSTLESFTEPPIVKLARLEKRSLAPAAVEPALAPPQADPPELERKPAVLERHETETPAPARGLHDGAAVREALAGHYDIHARTVTQLLVKLPGLRPGPGEAMEELVTDLVSVAAAVSRTHPVPTRAMPALIPCLRQGLARLPTYLGPVLAAGPPDARRWTSDDVLTTPSLLRAQGSGDGPTVLAIYSLTGRRPAILSDCDEILFAPGTVFHVLNVMDIVGKHWLFLREVSDSERAGPSDDFILSELMTIAMGDFQ